MADGFTILVGTAGHGVMLSGDGDESWQRVAKNQGMNQNQVVRALVTHPARPNTIYTGTDRGVFRSDDAGQNWQTQQSRLSDFAVWTMAIGSTNPNNMYAGTGTPSPVAMIRSTDGGTSWQRRPMNMVEKWPIGLPQMTGIAIEPTNPQSIWAGIEVDGLRHSSDGGETWNGVGIKDSFPYAYPRGITVHPDDPKTIFVTIGDATPGWIGTVMRSQDTGKTWENLPLSPQQCHVGDQCPALQFPVGLCR